MARPSRSTVAVVCALSAAVGLAACGSVGDDPTLEGRPAVEVSAGQTSDDGLIAGGTAEFERRLEALKGRPVVVNQWASWCPPCRAEFPFFQQAAKKYAGKVAFLGVNSGDMTPAAQEFLKVNPTPYPHLQDKDVDIARRFGGGRTWPTTAFYGPDGDVEHMMPGGYPSLERLERDIREHALDG